MFGKQLVIAALIGLISAESIYSFGYSTVKTYTQMNFKKQILNGRNKGSSVIHFFKESDGKSQGMVVEMEKFAKDNQGIFRSGAVDCEEWKDICAKENVTTFPTVKMYPPFPVPVSDLDLTNGFESINLKKKMAKHISDKSIEITNNNVKTFVGEDVSVPKVLLFTNSKKGTPFVFKALSHHFEKTLQFGLVRESEDAIASKYKIKKFPTLLVIKSEGKPLRYDGKEFSYSSIFEFINVHSQIFVDPTSKDNEVKVSSASKPWMTVHVPQIAIESGNDVCLKKDGALCVILVNGDSNVQKRQLDVLSGVSQGFASKISRGISFYFSWLDSSTEPEFAKVFGIEQNGKPQIVILNPGKRKRFLIHEGGISAGEIEKTLDKILGGDARFKTIKGNKLPALVSTYPEQS